MPLTKVIFFQEADGTSPVVEWLRQLRKHDVRVYAKCRLRIERLAELGYELRRPEADVLRDGIYELRFRLGSMNYRILYFFHGRNVAILAHGITKEDEIPDVEINRSLARKTAFEKAPEKHTYTEEL